MKSNLELVKQFCKHFAAKDKESYLKLCDDNIVWPSTTNMEETEGAACVGKKQMFDERLPRFFSSFKRFETVYEEFLDAGDSIVVVGKYRITSKTGKDFQSPFAQIYTIKNSKIVKFRQYADSATIQCARMLQ